MRRRRILALAAALTLLLGACAFGGAQTAAGTPASFYYVRRGAAQLQGGKMIEAEVRGVNVLSLWDFLSEYLRGPVSEELISPFPAGTAVLDIQYPDDILTMKMSGAFYTLTGVDLSLASCCLTDTVCEYTGRDTVVLVDETESIRMELRPDQFGLSNELPMEDVQSFTVYFTDGQHRYLTGETRNATLSRNETEEAYVLRQLLDGPQSGQLEPVLPHGTELREVHTQDGVCEVSLSMAFVENRPEDMLANYMAIYGVVNTLTGIDGVDAVRFLAEGEPIAEYGVFSLTDPVPRYTECIGPARTTGGELDLDMYALSEAEQRSYRMPCRVKLTDGRTLSEAVVARTLSYEPPPGFYNPIPYGTELLSISVSGSTCYMDLSERFIPQEDSEAAERAAVAALLLPLEELGDIRTAVLTIGGESGGLQYVDISEPLPVSGIE